MRSQHVPSNAVANTSRHPRRGRPKLNILKSENESNWSISLFPACLFAENRELCLGRMCEHNPLEPNLMIFQVKSALFYNKWSCAGSSLTKWVPWAHARRLQAAHGCYMQLTTGTRQKGTSLSSRRWIWHRYADSLRFCQQEVRHKPRQGRNNNAYNILHCLSKLSRLSGGLGQRVKINVAFVFCTAHVGA